MITAITNFKTHFIYVIIMAIGLVYVIRHPTPEAKRSVVNNTNGKELAKQNVVDTNKVTTIKTIRNKPDGSKTTVIEKIVDKSVVYETTKKVENQEQHIETYSYRPSYTLQAIYPLNFTELEKFNYMNMQIVGGARIEQLPVLINVGTTLELNKFFIGVTLEL